MYKSRFSPLALPCLCEKRRGSSQLLLCLSRACLGKVIVFSITMGSEQALFVQVTLVITTKLLLMQSDLVRTGTVTCVHTRPLFEHTLDAVLCEKLNIWP